MQILKNGSIAVFRPIEPRDQPKLKTFVSSLSKESMHMRFFEEKKEIPDEMLRKLSNPDYRQEMAIVTEPQSSGGIIAVARLVPD